MAAHSTLYEKVASRIAGMIEQGVYRPGDRVPSLRELSRTARVSLNTALEAYVYLENLGFIGARPQSGFYVCSRLPEPDIRAPGGEAPSPRAVEVGDVRLRALRNLGDPALVPLGHAQPNTALLPAGKLSRILAAQARRFETEIVGYSPAQGTERLRKMIARRSLAAGAPLAPGDIVITSGCMEAVTLALQATCRAGDTVAIGSPVFYSFLNSIQCLGLKILEIPSTPREGVSIEALANAMHRTPVAACLIISNFNNPLGGAMPEENKRELVALLARHDAPLIEDDVYGDLSYAPVRPGTAKAHDRKGLVLLCSSFSKTLAPGYRIGWIAPGRYQAPVERLKSVFHGATASPTQLAMAEFLSSGGYDRHLRSIRRAYAQQAAWMREAVGRHFPAGTQVTRPEGGYVLWLVLPERIDGMKLHEKALRAGIAVAPGTLFTTGGGFRNCVRLNAALWSRRVEAAIEKLGRLAGSLAALVAVVALLAAPAAAQSLRAKALEALQSHVAEQKYRDHSRAVEAILRELAPPADREEWGVAGLLHDIDIGATAGKPTHGVEGAKIVRELGFPEAVAQAIRSHDDGAGVPRTSRLDHALYCADQVYWINRGKKPVPEKVAKECEAAGSSVAKVLEAARK